MIGRAGALLVDIAIDTVPRGYRLAARPGAITRRAVSFLDEDVDALEEAWERAGLRGSNRIVKVQAPGPVTLATQVELPNGHRAITDRGALRDLAASLAEGVAIHCAEVARRLQTTVVVQLDEPSLADALTGRLTGVTALTPVHPVDETTAVELLDQCVATVASEVAVHTCSSSVPWKALCRTAIHAISLDVSRLDDGDLDGLAEFVDTGRTVMLGVVPTTAPSRPPSAEVKRIRGGAHGSARVRPHGVGRPCWRHPGVRAGRCHGGLGPHSDRADPEGGKHARRRPGGDLALVQLLDQLLRCY